ncbi:hypothetical protein MSAN_00219400 [Mycena sanguinolenta]|uniref:Uncharacterized protein n=1 Tax=Mycena sanguinolenta TaxID=230812 RepID=A0A8H6ZFC3_9AGAR|nr:hypothetical protein MSAN_00219400 [Mycena sanguinolenta]
MTKFASSILIAAAALTAVTAAYIPRDDQECASFEGLLSSSNPQFSCLAPFGKLASVSASVTANTTVTQAASALDNWFTEFCAVPACSTDTLNQVVNITSGCSDFNGTNFAETYPEYRELFCLKDTTNNTFCTTEALSSGSNSTDTLGDTSSTPDTNPEDILFFLALGASGSDTCNECTKAQYQVAVKFGQTDASGLLDQCGANFVASLNSTTVGIQQTAVTESKNGASSITPTSLLILLAVSGFWAVLL